MTYHLLVLGATGTLGQPVVRSLAERGHRVRVLARNAHQARQLFGDLAEVVEGDSTHRDRMRTAMAGCSAVHISLPMDQYCQWKRADGSPFDPWIRVHVQSGGALLHPCEEAMAVKDTIEQWTRWTGMELPGDGSYVVPGGLVPISVDLNADEASYIEPGVWILHRTARSRQEPGQ